MNKKMLIDAIGLLLMALIVVVGYKLSPLLLPKADVTATPDPACDLHRKPCSAELPGGGRVELSLVPRPIPMVKPLRLEVAVQGRRVSAAEVDFAGVSMNMGLNRPRLIAGEEGHFSGQATLPVCVTGTMDWQATVLLETERERIAVPFRFGSQPR
ncbi:MAG: hypothetical protein KA603_08895 [Azonexus sp.]|nr:hypothetical protein [Azonexus sp.]MBP6906758.1 hypothetical protein [Azonexus sp.]